MRPKLIVLHNTFFLVLAFAVYMTVIPPFERRVASAKNIEVSLVTQIFSEDRPLRDLPKMESYDYREGSATDVHAPGQVKEWLDQHPGDVWQNTPASDYLFRKDPHTGIYRRITLPNLVYDAVVERAKVTLLAVLGFVYILAVIVLEFVVMPRYVYQPLTLMLQADKATREDNRGKELIPEAFIPDDEIGQIMRSRNETIHLLRKQEDELAAALRHLEAQDRLASLGLLSASVAHELNTPLAVLRGSAERLAETVKDPGAQERLTRMLKVTQRIQTISESLLDFARVRKEETGRVDLRKLIDDTWSLVAIDEKAGSVQFVNEVDPNYGVTGNGDRLGQVFVNLVRNSLNAVHSGGHVWVRATPRDRDGEKWMSITVEDDGPGIPADVLPAIFDAFVSTRLDSKGTGLGLMVAEGIVRQHGGSINAGNRPGGGARLEMILKRAE